MITFCAVLIIWLGLHYGAKYDKGVNIPVGLLYASGIIADISLALIIF